MIDTSDLTPELARKAVELEKRARDAGLDFAKTSGLRTFAKQADMRAVYLTDPAQAKRRGIRALPAPFGWSRHNPGPDGLAWAVDIDGDFGSPGSKDSPKQRQLGEMAKILGLVWGGDWADPDYVHFEVPGLHPEANYVLHAERLDSLYRFMRELRG